METLHRGLADVYLLALSATALPTFQLPRAAMLPTILIVCPKVVVFSSLKVTTAVEAHAVDVVVEAVVELVPVAVLVIEVMIPV